MLSNVIESNVPLPTDFRRTGRPSKYRFGDMQIGDSFIESVDRARALRNSMAAYGMNHSMKFVVRTEGKEHVRCWRIA